MRRYTVKLNTYGGRDIIEVEDGEWVLYEDVKHHTVDHNTSCCFCGKYIKEVAIIVAGKNTSICNLCIGLACEKVAAHMMKDVKDGPI